MTTRNLSGPCGKAYGSTDEQFRPEQSGSLHDVEHDLARTVGLDVATRPESDDEISLADDR